MRVVFIALLVSWSCQAASPAQPGLLGWIDADGQIVLQPVGGTVTTGGLDLTSASGSLIPIPPGDLSAPSGPFDFVISNEPTQVTLGSLGRAVPIAEPLRLGVGFNLVEADPCTDVQIGTTASPFVNRFCTIPGDVDFDGHVGFGDFLLFADNFSSTEANWTMGDFDWDKKVGLSDFVVLRGNFGRSIPAPSVANAAEPDLNDVGVTMTVVNEILNWHDPDYGDSLDDDNLEFLMQSIRWNVPPGVNIDLDVEEGASYKLQLLFAESCCDRGFDIFMEDEEVVADLIVQQQQGGINNQETGVVYSREFVAGDDQLNILLGGSVGVPDNNPILNGITLERIEDIVVAPMCDPNTMGDIDGDGSVGFTDFLILSTNFGNEVAGHTEGDVDCDGSVGFPDFLILSANFGTTVGEQAASQSVPEPSSLALMGFALFGLGCVRGRRQK